MNAHTPFDANQDWTNPYCQNSSNDPMVDALLGNAYHVVRTVYCNLGNLKLLYDFLNQYGMVLGVQSEAELKALTTKAKYARIYGFSRAGDRQVTDYLYVEGDRTGILPDDTTATGSWITVATSGSNGGGTSSGEGAYIPWVYANGSAAGGETTINVPDGTVGVPFIIVNGDMQYVGRGFEFNVENLSVTLAQPLEEGDEVVFLMTGVPAVPDNPNVSDWVQINWLYNNGAAVGGEQVIAIPYTFQSVPAVYKNGLRLYKALPSDSYTIDSDNNRIFLTEPLATNDRLIVQLGGEANVLEVVDHTIQEVARTANVKDNEVILSTDTTQVLNGKKVVFSVNEQKSYGLPTLPTNVYIQSVDSGKLTYSPGSVVVDLLAVPNSANELDNLLSSVMGASKVITASGKSVQEFIDRDYLKSIGDVRGWGDGEEGFNAAMDEMSANGGGTLFVNEDILFTSLPIMHKEHVTVRWNAVAKVKTGLTAEYAYIMDGGADTPTYNNSHHFTKANKTNCYNLFLVAEDYTVGISAKGVCVRHCYGWTYEGGAIIGFNNGGFYETNNYEGKASKFTLVVANTRLDNSVGFESNSTDSWFSEISPVGYSIGLKFNKSATTVEKVHPWGNTVDNLVGVMGKMNIGIVITENAGFSTYRDMILDTPVRKNIGSVPSRTNGGVGVICDAWDCVLDGVLVLPSRNDSVAKSTLPMITTTQRSTIKDFQVSAEQYVTDIWISFENNSGIARNHVSGYGYAEKMRTGMTYGPNSGAAFAGADGVTISGQTLSSGIWHNSLSFSIATTVTAISSATGDVIVNIAPVYGVKSGFGGTVKGGMYAFYYATTNSAKQLYDVSLEVVSDNTAKFLLTFVDGTTRYAHWTDVSNGSPRAISISGIVNIK